MRILMSGGGTAGHITPIKYVAQAVKQMAATAEIVYVGPMGDQFESIVRDEPAIDRVKSILAAKYRRYPGSLISKLLDIKTIVLNIRDFFFFWVGLLQSIWIVARFKPHVMLSKGGSVSVPLALAARLFKVPIITHDSDTLPSKSNSLIAKWAVKNAVSHEPSMYQYEPSKMVHTGVPLSLRLAEFQNMSQTEVKKALKLPDDEPVVVVVGGSLGSASINKAILKIAHGMTDAGINFVHVTGQAHFNGVRLQTLNYQRFRALGFVEPEEMMLYFKSADVVVTRGGATATAELAALSKPLILIPASQLLDQKKNAEHIYRHKAAVVLTDETITADATQLEHAIFEFISNQSVAEGYGSRLSAAIKQDGSFTLAKLLLEVGQ